MNRTALTLLCLTTTLMGLGACQDPAPSADPRAPIIEALALEVFVPSYQKLEDELAHLEQQTQSLCQAPSAQALEQSRQAWHQARRAQRATTFLALGLYADLRLDAYLDREPVDTQSIETFLASDQEITLASVEQLGANKRGLPALEYLLFPDENAQEPPLLAQDNTISSQRRCELLVTLSKDAHTQVQPLNQAWSVEPPGAEYLAFKDAGQDKSRYMSRQDLFSMLLNHVLARQEIITYTEIGGPSGLKDDLEPDPKLVRGYRAQSGVEGISAQLNTLKLIMCGAELCAQGAQVTGLLAPTKQQTPELAQRLLDALDDSIAKLEALPAPLEQSVVSAPQEVEAAYESQRALIRLIKTEWAAQLGVVVTFNDNDGD